VKFPTDLIRKIIGPALFIAAFLQSKIGEAIRYTLSNWELLNNYLNDGRIEIDNNLLENAIRSFAVGRKNWLFMVVLQKSSKEVCLLKAA
jgi:hypothetical protein